MSDAIYAYFNAAEFENVEKIVARFTPENAALLGKVVAERTRRIVAERDRLRKALSEALEDWDNDHFDEEYPYRIEWADKARAALQKAVNQLPDATKLIAENNRLRALADKNEEAADALWAERDRLLEEMRRYLPVIERCEGLPALWTHCTKGTGIATANGYRAALQEADDEPQRLR